jgi:glycosyltransferase involved in cell wall biosynthesis
MRAPLVSVVMAVYNGADLVGESIASALAQSHEALELLVVDDGSADTTAAVVRQWAERDRRVRLLSCAHAGQALALNEGIATSRGAYVARLDHDDLWHRDRLKLQLACIEQKGLDVCGSWVRRIGDARGVIRFPVGHEAIRHETLFTCPILDSATLFRAEILRDHPYPPSAIVRTEMVQLVRLLGRYRFGNMPRILAQYRMHAAQKTKRLAGLAAYRQRQLQEQHFRTMFPDAGAEERETFALTTGDEPLGRDELLSIADLFIRRLRSPDAEARQRVVLHWRRLAGRRSEPRLAPSLHRHLDEAFLA